MDDLQLTVQMILSDYDKQVEFEKSMEPFVAKVLRGEDLTNADDDAIRRIREARDEQRE